MDPRSVRRFLNLRLIDLERATGISSQRLSEAERGITRLKPAEQRAVMNFLRARLAGALGTEVNES